MSEIAILLILASAFIHAAWNFIAKRTVPTAAFFLTANAFGAWIFFPWLVLYPDLLFSIPDRIWAFLILTGLFQALYCIALSAAYRHGDLSLAYPISRSLPVILVPIVALILGRGELLGIWFFAGAFLILAGGTLVSFEELRSMKKRPILNSVLPMALLAAIGTAGYSLVDDQSLRMIRGSLGAVYGTVPLTLVYAFLEGLACAAWIGIFMLLTRKRTGGSCLPLGSAMAAGLLMYLTYGMVLVSMAFARDVSLIVAFRQVSILAGALLGIIFLKESAHRLKSLGLFLLLAGLFMVASS